MNHSAERDAARAALRVAVLAGGISAERPVSLQSGAAVAVALARRGHQVRQIDPALVDLYTLDWRQWDVAFLALHGTFGEDGQVQTLLDEVGIPYTGSSAEASRLAFSKSAAKERFAQRGVLTPAYVLAHRHDDPAQLAEAAAKLEYPLAVKPDAQGSSLGVSIISSPDELSAALQKCFSYDHYAIIEHAILGTEWTLGVLHGQPLPLIEIQTPRGFYDYQAKYEDDETRYLLDSLVAEDTRSRLRRIGLDACRALRVSGVARVDIRLDHAGNPWVLEVNTIPGMTDHSLVPKAAAAMGIEFGELCERIMKHCHTRALAEDVERRD